VWRQLRSVSLHCNRKTERSGCVMGRECWDATASLFNYVWVEPPHRNRHQCAKSWGCGGKAPLDRSRPRRWTPPRSRPFSFAEPIKLYTTAARNRPARCRSLHNPFALPAALLRPHMVNPRKLSGTYSNVSATSSVSLRNSPPQSGHAECFGICVWICRGRCSGNGRRTGFGFCCGLWSPRLSAGLPRKVSMSGIRERIRM
jgi:hypothetical protein